MATWKTETQKLETWVSNKFGNAQRNVSNFFQGTLTRAINEVTSFFKNGTTVVGINIHQIDSMKAAIRTYVTNIDTALDKLNECDPEVAFKSEEDANGTNKGIVYELKEYIKAVKEACSAITSNLLAFNDQLTAVKNAYMAKDAANAQQIHSEGESTKSAYTKYTEQTNSGN